MRLTSTHTFAELEVSPATYDEIAEKLRAAEYDHSFMDDGTIDMHGIGLTRRQQEKMDAALATPSPSYVTRHDRGSKCKCPYSAESEHECWCHEHMGNDFWFLPAVGCIYEKPNRVRDAWRKLCSNVKQFCADLSGGHDDKD